MVKHIYAEDSIKTFIEHMVKKKKPEYGMIIGRMTATKYFATKLIRVPEKVENSTDQFQIDDAWLAGSAAEVANMLPGGVCIIGIFAFAPSNQKLQQDLRQALYVTHKILSKSRSTSLVTSKDDIDALSYWSTIHFEINTGKPIICTQFDIRNHVSSSTPAEWRYQTSNVRWGLVKANLEIDETLYLNQISANVTKQLNDTIVSYCDKIANAIVEFDESVPQPEKIFLSDHHPPTEASVRNGKKSEQNLIQSYECNMFLPYPIEESPSESIDPSSHRYVVRVKGIIYACAYFLSNATAQEVINELKADAISGLHHRCKIAAEDWQDAEKTLKENSVIVLPKRVGFSEQQEDFMYFDYVFEEELLEDCTKRIKDQFGADVQPEDLVTDLEDFPSILDINEVADESDDDDPLVQVDRTNVKSSWFHSNNGSSGVNIPFVLAVGMIVALMLGILLLRT